MINVFSGIDDKDDPNSQYYIKLNSCDRHNKKAAMGITILSKKIF